MNNKYRFSLIIFFLFTSSYFISTVGIMNSSDAPQYALTKALVEEKSINIESFSTWVSPDYALYNKRMFSLRSIGESLFMIPFYLWGKAVSPFAQLPYDNLTVGGINYESKLEALTVLGNATAGALIMVILYLFLIDLTGNQTTAILTVLTGGFGTLFWRYSSHMQRFPITSFFLILSFYLIYKSNINKYKTINLISAVCGLFLGISILVDSALIFMTVPMLIAAAITLYKKYKQPILTIIFFLFFCIPITLNLAYNYLAFDNPFKIAYQFQATKNYYNNISDYYKIPLLPSLLVNLFSRNPIPENAFGEKWNDVNFRRDEGMEYANQLNYLGIFSQTPVLIFSVFGIIYLINKNKLIGLTLLFTPLINIIQNSKFIVFYGPNSFDTHYFLPSIPFLLIGSGILIAKVWVFKSNLVRKSLKIMIIAGIVLSIYNGWYSNITNYAPHVSGEHRFDFNTLTQESSSYYSFLLNAGIILINTFPNLTNIEVLYAFYLFPISILYFLYYYFTQLKKIK